MFEELRTRYFNNERIKDHEFDQWFPADVRRHSRIHWTPFEVASRACDFLVTDASTRVLDIGAGIGKFCMVGALTTNAQFTGIEIRDSLASVGRDVIRDNAIPRVNLITGDFSSIDWNGFDSFYLYNPFHENAETSIRIDSELSFSQKRYYEYVDTIEIKLRGLKVGARVATYHGFGGEIPDGFTLFTQEFVGTGVLEVWEKSAAEPAALF